MSNETPFQPLKEFLSRVPAINSSIGYGLDDDGYWWLKVSIDIDHPLAWNVVQELGHVLNYLSLNERLPTVFKPVSPPPYMNGGGPRDVLGSLNARIRISSQAIAQNGWKVGCHGPSMISSNGR
ncbi:MAG TPA: hypothetical protein VKB47_06055 [Terracidiphilus sp.]|nr:hypothetical protein [Terracidiphilus sp.]